MTEGTNRQWILNSRPTGKLTGEEFLWNEVPIPRPSDGQALIRTVWLSVDPAQRIWMARDSYKPAVPLGDVMQSFAVGQVIESRDPDFKPDDLVRGDFSWQDYVATDGKGFGGMQKLPAFSCLIMNHFPEAMGKKRTKMVTGIVNEMRAINHSTCY